MNFLNLDLGHLGGGEIVRVDLSGVESDVMLMNDHNVRSFAGGREAEYVGGHFKRSPAVLSVPKPGRWHAIVVPGFGGNVTAKVAVSRLN